MQYLIIIFLAILIIWLIIAFVIPIIISIVKFLLTVLFIVFLVAAGISACYFIIKYLCKYVRYLKEEKAANQRREQITIFYDQGIARKKEVEKLVEQLLFLMNENGLKSTKLLNNKERLLQKRKKELEELELKYKKSQADKSTNKKNEIEHLVRKLLNSVENNNNNQLNDSKRKIHPLDARKKDLIELKENYYTALEVNRMQKIKIVAEKVNEVVVDVFSINKMIVKNLSKKKELLEIRKRDMLSLIEDYHINKIQNMPKDKKQVKLLDSILVSSDKNNSDSNLMVLTHKQKPLYLYHEVFNEVGNEIEVQILGNLAQAMTTGLLLDNLQSIFEVVYIEERNKPGYARRIIETNNELKNFKINGLFNTMTSIKEFKESMNEEILNGTDIISYNSEQVEKAIRVDMLERYKPYKYKILLIELNDSDMNNKDLLSFLNLSESIGVITIFLVTKNVVKELFRKNENFGKNLNLANEDKRCYRLSVSKNKKEPMFSHIDIKQIINEDVFNT